MRHIRIQPTRRFRGFERTVYRIDLGDGGYPHFCFARTFASAASYAARVYL